MLRRGVQTYVKPDLYDRTYFLGHCGGHEVYAESQGERLDARLSVILQMGRIQSGMRILDLGCGRGELVRHAAQMGAVVWGLDLSQEALGISKATLSQASESVQGRTGLCMASAGRLPFRDRSFHRILLSDILEHLNPAELKQMLGEVHRVSRMDGRVVFHTFPNGWFYNIYYPLRRLLWDAPQGKAGPRNPRTHYERVMHVNELSPLGLMNSFRRLFSMRLWCARRNDWDSRASRFRRGRLPHDWLAQPEIWGVGEKRKCKMKDAK
jgi:SAM-dependent methyltransferase